MQILNPPIPLVDHLIELVLHLEYLLLQLIQLLVFLSDHLFQFLDLLVYYGGCCCGVLVGDLGFLLLQGLLAGLAFELFAGG